MSNNFGCKLALKADEHDQQAYPFVIPNVFLEEYADPMLYDGGTKSLVLIEGDKMATYTRGSYIEIHKRDTAGNTMWVKSMDLDDFDDDHWDDEYEEEYEESVADEVLNDEPRMSFITPLVEPEPVPVRKKSFFPTRTGTCEILHIKQKED